MHLLKAMAFIIIIKYFLQQPKRLYSPQTTLNIQKGTCFEYSSLLASMLIGLGYDAYVVSGYATKKVCLVDQSSDSCPLLIEEKKVQCFKLVR